ncbi:hypothetical protein M0R45_005242 [Rubus argutus]|uniref:Uncharacterized protein n=1 Tax=Rubus argutus TaxID=59490 RepID=A0AAW1YLW7_RUBAR
MEKLEGHKGRPGIQEPKLDGDEVLRFYSSTIACCNGELKPVSELCADRTCRVCEIYSSIDQTSTQNRNRSKKTNEVQGGEQRNLCFLVLSYCHLMYVLS